MRCTTARKAMIHGLGEVVGDTGRRALAEHLEHCAACRAERRQTDRLLAALGELRGDASVSAAFEQAVMRRVRTSDDERASPWERMRQWLPMPVLAAGVAAVLILFVSDPGRRAVAPEPVATKTSPSVAAAPPTRVATARPTRTTTVVAQREPAPASGRSARGEAPAPIEPPAELADSLPLLLDLPILRNMEKLENYERIEAVTLVDDQGANG